MLLCASCLCSRVSFLRLPRAMQVTWGEVGSPGTLPASLPAVACGTAAERGTTNPLKEWLRFCSG